MDTINDTVAINALFPALRAENKDQLFRQITEKAALTLGINPDALFEKMRDSDERMTSAIGEGVAIPNMRLRDIPAPYALFAKLTDGIVFDTIDNQPVDLVFLMLSPEEDGPYHLRRLSRITRMFRDRVFCSRLRGADNDNVLRSLFTNPVHYTAAA
jgi:PTS system nitrogen regulatory IIA component